MLGGAGGRWKGLCQSGRGLIWASGCFELLTFTHEYMHKYRHLLVWMRRWRCKENGVRKRALHSSHWKGLSSEWVCRQKTGQRPFINESTTTWNAICDALNFHNATYFGGSFSKGWCYFIRLMIVTGGRYWLGLYEPPINHPQHPRNHRATHGQRPRTVVFNTVDHKYGCRGSWKNK